MLSDRTLAKMFHVKQFVSGGRRGVGSKKWAVGGKKRCDDEMPAKLIHVPGPLLEQVRGYLQVSFFCKGEDFFGTVLRRNTVAFGGDSRC